MNALAGRAAIVTGASQGLGLAIAEAFAAAGADLMLCARTGADLEAAAKTLRQRFPGRRIERCVADMGRREDIDALFSAARIAFPHLHALVNNAGVHGPIGALDELDWDAWEGALRVNLVGTAYASRCAVKAFKPQRYGKIINLSGGGATAPQPGLSAYGASKAALVRFSETLAHEVKDVGIDVNAVAPGALVTRLTRELADAGAERIGADYHRMVKAMLAEGGGSPAQAAALCVYLASAQSDGVTGRLISATWDPWPFNDEARADIAASEIYTLRRIVPADRGKPWGG
ncbi:MAG: SDR family NAD(P)-dependent oxidoreductase [Caulobacteraceae bacterium]